MVKKTTGKEESGCLENSPISVESQSFYSQKLDNLLLNMYTFVEVDEKVESQPLIEPCAVDHTISFHFLPVAAVNEKHTTNKKMRLWKPKPKLFEEITYEDMCSVVVSGDWVLNKQGVYGKGRERRSELITGAVHSSALKKCLNKK
uniref:Uncharacterized protein n=1 Tax=Daphnia galeata TaxID=27404 RepID=A0A8J2WL71_9CRUS|nr:unnamed protein product [Daphnia galeata]